MELDINMYFYIKIIKFSRNTYTDWSQNIFLKNDNNYKEINHKNGNKSDNTVNNLEWCSSSYNILHRYYILGKGIRKIQCVETGEIFSTCKEADIKLKVSLGSVSKVIRGVRKNVKGYSFIVYQP